MRKLISKDFKNIINILSILMIVGILCVAIYSSYQDYKSQFGSTTQTAVVVKQDISNIPELIINPQLFQFGISINKISIFVPVVANVDGTNKTAYNKALFSGVAHYKGTALPGENGNIFIFGHSSTWNGVGPYTQTFANLNNLETGDEITIFYQNKGYSYKVSKKDKIEADDFSYLEPTKSEQLTLMTCWPIGSDLKRLIVVAKPE